MIDQCTEPGLATLQQGLTDLLHKIEPIAQTEKVPLKQAIGRITAHEITSPIQVPPFNNSYMDGYALRTSEGSEGNTLSVIGTSFAGHPFHGDLSTDACVRIFTGAKIPKGADCVVMQEHVTVNSDSITLNQSLSRHENVRFAGDDLDLGQSLCGAGKRLQPADLGLLASVGIDQVEVYVKPKVAIFSTGDELVSVTEPLQEGQIHDSNRYLLSGLLTEMGIECTDLGVIPDQAEAVEKALRSASVDHDMVISSGGASVGDADFIVASVRKLGQVHQWKMAMKPGKPMVLGQIGQARFFGLPGNPVSVLVNFTQVVKPALLKLMGISECLPVRFPAKTTSKIHKQPGRMEFQRGLATLQTDGLWVESTGAQGSHILSSVTRANCLIVLPQDNAGLEAGDQVEIEFFQSPLFTDKI